MSSSSHSAAHAPFHASSHVVIDSLIVTAAPQAQSKPMCEIIARLTAGGEFEIVSFGDQVGLTEAFLTGPGLPGVDRADTCITGWSGRPCCCHMLAASQCCCVPTHNDQLPTMQQPAWHLLSSCWLGQPFGFCYLHLYSSSPSLRCSCVCCTAGNPGGTC